MPSGPPPPYVSVAIKYVAGKKGMVSVSEILPAPNGSIAVQVNLKITRPNDGAAGKADLVISGTKSSLEEVIYDMSDHQRFFTDENTSSSSPVLDGDYTNGCPCVCPLDLSCPDGEFQKPFNIESPVKGSSFQITGTLTCSRYLQGDAIEGILLVVLTP